MRMNYRQLEQAAFRMRLAAREMEDAATRADDAKLFFTYCEMIVQLEKIRDIVAGMDRG